MGEVTWVVKNPETIKYYNFQDSEWGLIQLFDGTRTRAEILEEYRREFPREDIPLSLVLDFEEMLRKVDLIEQSVAERNLQLLARAKTARQRAAEEKAEGRNIFFLPFHVLDPERFLVRTVKYVRWIWTPPVVLAWCLAMLWTVGIFVQHWAPIWSGTLELYAFLKKPLLDAIQFFLLLSIIGCIHEFAHAYTTKIYGGEVHDIGIALLYFTPAFYCDTTDSLLFESKWHRLWTTTAGIYIEGFICFAATLLWVISYPDSFLNEFAYKTMLFTGASTVFFNINPLIKIDGYYALSSVLEVPELREESFGYLGALFQRKVLRLPVEIPEHSRRKRRIFWIYGPLALAYVGVVMAFIGGLFFNFYSKYFPNLAVLLLVLTLLRLFRKRVRLVTRTARLFYLDKKDLIMSNRSRKPLLAGAAVLALLLLVPWTHRKVHTDIRLRPATEARLEAPEDAVVAEVLASEGDIVAAGQPVFRLESPALAARGLEFSAERRYLEKEANRARGASDPAVAYAAERRGASVESELASDRARSDRLVVRSPLTGSILTPRLADWKGRHVVAGTTLAEVGDTRRLRADLDFSERRLEDVRIGGDVSAMLPGRPLRPAHGKIVEVSAATLEHPATPSSMADPSAPPARPDRFVARAEFDNADGSLRPGMTGLAKISGPRVSLLVNVVRILKRWLQTVLW
ncbi:MAG TPA: efflux RND transporter periplasmic adaptor subunit [Thermoanaerobaculia bacterium]|nr:efflux RND transporter periplasmic adaptor subunit [Thermoanaerobaculia bacterium]